MFNKIIKCSKCEDIVECDEEGCDRVLFVRSAHVVLLEMINSVFLPSMFDKQYYCRDHKKPYDREVSRWGYNQFFRDNVKVDRDGKEVV